MGNFIGRPGLPGGTCSDAVGKMQLIGMILRFPFYLIILCIALSWNFFLHLLGIILFPLNFLGSIFSGDKDSQKETINSLMGLNEAGESSYLVVIRRMNAWLEHGGDIHGVF